MSQASQLNIYFVLPQEDKQAECSKDMYDAFTCVKQYRGKPQWVLPSFCIDHLPTINDVFVFDEFKGEAFEKLKRDSSKILGAKCMLTCMSAGDTIPPGKSPIFTEGMRGLIVCCTGFDQDTRKQLQEKIEYMGGIFHPTLRSIITHVVAYNNLSSKAVEAFKVGKPVMTQEWVEAVWKRSLEANVRGGDDEFKKYLSPLFHNLKFTTSGITKRKKDQLKEMINQNGGTFTGTLELNSTNVLVIDAAVGDKYKAAKEWKITCVKSSWVRQSVEIGKIAPVVDHSLKESANKASTPKKDGIPVNFTANFSMVSAIELEDKNLTRMEETVYASQPSNAQAQRTLSIKDPNAELVDTLAEEALEAGQFLDGCNIFLSGFSQALSEKLRRILNLGGATRFDELTRSVTHIVVAGAISDVLRESGAHVVTLQWLAESATLRKPAPVQRYRVEESSDVRPAPPSPLSKQSARLLSRPEARSLAIELEAAEEPLPAEDDLVHRYNLSQQGEPIAERAPVHALTPNAPSFASSRSDMTLTNSEPFKGLKFFLSKDLAPEELEGGERLIIGAGGTVVSRKFTGVPNYAVVPIAGAALAEVTALEVVNLLFVRECAVENRIVPIHYYHLPIAWLRKSTPLRDCVMSVSNYVRSERDFIETIIETLGAVVQAILAKKKKDDILKTTHLICATPSGNKFNGAVRWGLPVVHHDWLMKCAELGTRVPEEQFIVSENKVPTTPLANGTNLATPTSVRRPNPMVPTSVGSSVFLRTDNSIGQYVASSSRKQTEKPPQAADNLRMSFMERSRTSEAVEENPVLRPIPALSPNISREQPEQPLTPVQTVARKAPLEMSISKTPTNRSTRPEQEDEHPARTPLFEAVASPLNKALERLKNRDTPGGSFSPELNNTITPKSPYGACFGNDNPSPGTRKRLYKWTHQGAHLPLDPPAKDRSPNRKKSTPLSDIISRELRLQMREDQPPDDSPDLPPAKRLNFSHSASESVKNDLMSGFQKMKEIEASYSANNLPIVSPATSSPAPRLVIVSESQPHTEIGWDDPSDRDLALACLEKAADQIVQRPVKIFMFSGMSEIVDAKGLIEASGGKVSALQHYDRSATHLIATANTTRAEKLMGSIAAGLWVLHPSYLERLSLVKDVYALKEEEFEWGSPRVIMPLDALAKSVRECVVSAHHWRYDIQNNRKPPPFSGMKFILKIAADKAEVFTRLLEAGGGEIKTVDSIKENDKVFCICQPQPLPPAEMESLAKKGIRCVTTLFISDVILRKPTAVDDNFAPGFGDVWRRWQI